MNRSRAGLASAAATLAAFLGLTCAALAQSPDYQTPPKLIKQGTNTSPIAGPGTVVVQVYVNADGTFKVTRVIKSTNHGDDAAALEIARTSTYTPATNGKKKVAQFYDYTLKFTGGSASATAGNALDRADADLRAGKYSDAKAAASSYLASHPDDARATALLGASNYFLNDYSGAAGAFNKLSAVPPQYKTVAANAYAKAAETALAAKDGSVAVADATKAYQLAPGAPTLNLLGTAQVVAGQDAEAVHSLEQARTLASGDPKMDSKQRATIDSNLVAAYVSTGQLDKAGPLVEEIKQLDPSNTTAAFRYYWAKADASSKAGDYGTAAAMYDKAGAVGGPYASQMYTNEAVALSQGAKPDWKAAKAAADKALAAKPDDAQANLVAGVALANDGKKAEAIPYLQKADASAKAAGNTMVASKAEAFLKQLGAGR